MWSIHEPWAVHLSWLLNILLAPKRFKSRGRPRAKYGVVVLADDCYICVNIWWEINGSTRAARSLPLAGISAMMSVLSWAAPDREHLFCVVSSLGHINQARDITSLQRLHIANIRGCSWINWYTSIPYHRVDRQRNFLSSCHKQTVIILMLLTNRQTDNIITYRFAFQTLT